MLSGFLITGILYDTQDDPHRARNFYIRRTLRIFPLYYGVLLFIFLLTPLMHWAWTWQWIAWPLYLGNFLRFLYPHYDNDFVRHFANAAIESRRFPGTTLNLGHFWTLCIEEQFYLIWPWIVFAVRDRRKLIAICVTCIVVMPFVRMFAIAHMPAALVAGDVTLHATFFRFDTLLTGALIALFHRGPHRERMQRVAQYVLSIAVACTLCLAVYVLHSHAQTYPRPIYTWALTVIAIFAAALVLRTLVPGTIAYRFFHLRWLRALGTISYGAYVFHDICHGPIAGFTNHWYGLSTSFLGFGLTLILATLSYRFFESPILRLKDRLTQSSTRSTVAQNWKYRNVEFEIEP